jgi:LPPG:FO 2-phospho-L-lactate transferase
MTFNGNVVLFVGGVGGARLAHGLYRAYKPEKLTIIVNTGDDFWGYGLRICPDLDTITYTLSEWINKTNGWGVKDDTFTTFNTLKRYGDDAWFNLGDQDLALHMTRTKRLQQGQTLTEVTQSITQALGIQCQILPMSDDAIETKVHTVHGVLDFQEYFVKYRWQPTLQSLEFRGASNASITPQISDALSQADAIIIGPSNPWLSIQPILKVPELRNRIQSLNIPRVAVTSIIAGDAVKGPTAKIMRELGLEVSVKTVVEYYGDLINGFIYDVRDFDFTAPDLKLIGLDTLMTDEHKRYTLAEQILRWLANWS